MFKRDDSCSVQGVSEATDETSVVWFMVHRGEAVAQPSAVVPVGVLQEEEGEGRRLTRCSASPSPET